MSGRIVIARSLRREVRFHCPDSACADQLAFVAADPVMPDFPTQPIRVDVVALGGGFYDFAPPFESGPGTAGHMVGRAHRILQDLLEAETSGAAILHGASLIVGGRRCLMVAQKGTGKTTLVLEALRRGISVEADEHVAVFADHVLARPRTLRIKAGSLDFAPELRDLIMTAPAIMDWNGAAIYSVAPRSREVEWRIRPGRADAIIALWPNHHGLTWAARLTREQAFASVLEHCFLPNEGKGAALANLHRLMGQASCWSMRVGDLGRAIWHLQQICR